VNSTVRILSRDSIERKANILIHNNKSARQLIEFEGDDKYCSAIAHNVEEAQKLIEIGFEYVCNHENVMLFRKRK